MKKKAMLTIQGTQTYHGQEPDTIQLVTEGTLEFRDGGWDICYEESDLTGLKGVMTTFRVEPNQIKLKRTGALNSQMHFQQGVPHDSLYQMELGTLMITVCATQVSYDINPSGGVVDLTYTIVIEQSEAGVIAYHLDIRTIED